MAPRFLPQSADDETLDDIGPFDQIADPMQDVELCMRLDNLLQREGQDA